MNNAISGLRILPAEIDLPASAGRPTAESSFGDMLQDAFEHVDQLQQEANYKVRSMLEGTSGDVHNAMIAVQKADLSFELMMQVRNKMVQAYQEIERMQF
jgi:flagellar hook-basal body complex protein FliE